ncbi:G-protein alpha subunit [Phanerochaete sordida]|uniref:G-protein alpha subunit n=1 Tax=Phanerochaete sordida TaxID=48140 RepID=A0A9P3LCA4_9APHY|nr:G-protein alpha subunit [Phanerochaete sordida]
MSRRASISVYHADELPTGDEEARRISNAIDEELRQEKELRKKKAAREVKVMLLGQAESGKSTLQKQFQLYYASHSLDQERPLWRPIVYSNILKALRMLMVELDRRYGSGTEGPGSTPASNSILEGSPEPSDPLSDPVSVYPPELLAMLPPLQSLVDQEDALASELSGGVKVTGRSGVFVRAGWQALITPNRAWPIADIRDTANRPTAVTNLVAGSLLHAQGVIAQFWAHPLVRALVTASKVRLEESAAFFLNNIHRIAQADYTPSTEDVLHVRLQTLGVTEHSIDIDIGGVRFNWLLYDVGGARGQASTSFHTRPSWVPYFEDATAIIFLAPMSAFDQYLEEDPRTNRIDDSLQLFTAICQNKLLAKAALVLMLNKADLLKKKLEAGIRVRKYISSYGDRPNTYEEVSEYFRAHFIQTHRRKDVSHRVLYTHFTALLDIKATQSIIISVGEAIMRQHLASVGLS